MRLETARSPDKSENNFMANLEGLRTKAGSLAVDTGVHTGRSARDKFIVRDEATSRSVAWDSNQPMEPDAFERLHADMRSYASSLDLYEQTLFAGADPEHRTEVGVSTELAWHALFIQNLLIRPAAGVRFSSAPELTILVIPSFEADPSRHGCRSNVVIACDFSRGEVLIAGTAYAGEIKKAVFSYLNFVLPGRGVLPMHCAANSGPKGDVALFFGLSGTGKTTLSTDPDRTLVGDDEHGWGDRGVFNFEGGCYAKTFGLTREREPQIYQATRMPGAILENVIIDKVTLEPDFADSSKTENGRAAFPLRFIPHASPTGVAGHPSVIILLTCDAFGVLPPLAKLTASQAVYHFLSGYTAKVAGTENGVSEPQATFSACFGAPFMALEPTVYGRLLSERIGAYGTDCWLLNTGWSGGPVGQGQRMPLSITRLLLQHILNRSLSEGPFRRDPRFGFAVPTAVPGVDPSLLDPASTWQEASAYAAAADHLVQLFQQNFERFGADDGIRQAFPQPLAHQPHNSGLAG